MQYTDYRTPERQEHIARLRKARVEAMIKEHHEEKEREAEKTGDFSGATYIEDSANER